MLTRAIDVVREVVAYARGPGKSLQSTIAPNPWQDRQAQVLGPDLTPELLSGIILDRNLGYLQRWVDLADEAREKDPHLHSQLSIREESVVETEFVVHPGKGSNQQQAKRAAAVFQELIDDWKKRSNNGFYQWLAEFTETIFYPAGLHEVLWTRDGRITVIDGLKKVHTRRLSFCSDGHDPDPWALRIWDPGVLQSPYSKFYGVNVSELHPHKTLVNLPRVRGAQQTREGLFAIVVWFWLFKIWSWRDVMALAEMLGRPPVIGYYAAGGAKADGARIKMNGARDATQDEIDAGRAVIESVTSALRAMLPDTVRLEALEYQMPTTEPMQLMISKLIDSYVSKAVHGVANLSDLKAGARAAVETQERTSYTFWHSDCRRAEQLLGTMARYIIEANPDYFRPNCPVPEIKAVTRSVSDRLNELKVIEAARKTGIRVPASHAYEVSGIPEPQDDEEVLGELPADNTTVPAPERVTDQPKDTPPETPNTPQ